MAGLRGRLGLWGRLGDCAHWGEDSRTHEAWSHGLDREDFLDHGEGRLGHRGPVVDCLDAVD